MIVIYFEIQSPLINTPFPSIAVVQLNYSKLPHWSELLSSIRRTPSIDRDQQQMQFDLEETEQEVQRYLHGGCVG
jgi:hypothetical protein